MLGTKTFLNLLTTIQKNSFVFWKVLVSKWKLSHMTWLHTVPAIYWLKFGSKNSINKEDTSAHINGIQVSRPVCMIVPVNIFRAEDATKCCQHLKQCKHLRNATPFCKIGF